MNQSPGMIFKQYLIDQDLAIDPADSGDWPVYVSHLPDGEGVLDNALCIYDTTGVKDGRPMGGVPLFHHGFQIKVRATTYAAGWAKAQELADAFAAVANAAVEVDSESFTIVSVTQSTSVVPLGVEEGTKRRDQFTVNFLATLREE